MVDCKRGGGYFLDRNRDGDVPVSESKSESKTSGALVSPEGEAGAGLRLENRDGAENESVRLPSGKITGMSSEFDGDRGGADAPCREKRVGPELIFESGVLF